MSKQYGYFEAMEEVLNDKNKVFKKENPIKTMYYDIKNGTVMIKRDDVEHSPYINIFWKDTKWTLVNKKKYNVRVYNNVTSELISSDILEMTEKEIKEYCNNVIIEGDICSPIIIGTWHTYRGGIEYKRNYKIVAEEIIKTKEEIINN